MKRTSESWIEEMVKHKDFEKSGTEVETIESMEEVKFPRGYDSDFPMIVILDGKKKVMIDLG